MHSIKIPSTQHIASYKFLHVEIRKNKAVIKLKKTNKQIISCLLPMCINHTKYTTTNFLRKLKYKGRS